MNMNNNTAATNPIPEIPDEEMSTSETIRARILSIPMNEDFVITVEIGGDIHGCD